MTELAIGDLQGNNTDNNGNVKRMYHFLPDGKTPQRDDYAYDPLNRITAMTECQRQVSGNATITTVASQGFGYDRYGNRAITAVSGGVNGLSIAFSATNNRITTANYGCDSVGNLINEAGNSRTYDAENRIFSATGGSYVYDGDGKRIKRTTTSPNQTCWYVYGIGGELLAEYLSTAPTTATKQYGYEGGKLLVTAEGATLKWLVSDHLGSTRIELYSSGSVATRHDFLPFGEELFAGIRNSSNAYEPPVSTTRQRFTGKERDNETGLDYFGARYAASLQGRFMSPDPLLSSGTVYRPQSWNRYTYTLNNPLKFVDPSGLYSFAAGTTIDQQKQFEKALKQLEEARNKFKKDKNSDEYKKLDRAYKAYGTPGDNNGVTVKFGAAETPGNTAVNVAANGGTLTGPDITVTINPSQNLQESDILGTVAHEGSHVADGLALIATLPKNLTDTQALTSALNGPLNLTSYETEMTAYTVTAYTMQVMASKFNLSSYGVTSYGITIWSAGWKEADRATNRAIGINECLCMSKESGGRYDVTAAHPGKKLIPE